MQTRIDEIKSDSAVGHKKEIKKEYKILILSRIKSVKSSNPYWFARQVET